MSHKITMFDIQQLMTSPKWFSDAAKTNFLNVAQYTHIYHYLYTICILLQWKLQKKKNLLCLANRPTISVYFQ